MSKKREKWVYAMLDMCIFSLGGIFILFPPIIFSIYLEGDFSKKAPNWMWIVTTIILIVYTTTSLLFYKLIKKDYELYKQRIIFASIITSIIIYTILYYLDLVLFIFPKNQLLLIVPIAGVFIIGSFGSLRIQTEFSKYRKKREAAKKDIKNKKTR